MREIWKPISGFEGKYAISSLGRVKSLCRTEALLTPKLHEKGYLRVCLYKDGKKSFPRIHRLVAEHFLSNPCNHPDVNHIDGNKLNNRVDNLEYLSHSDNLKHAVRTGLLIPPCRRGGGYEEWVSA